MSTYEDNRLKQKRSRGSDKNPSIQDRIGAFLNFLAGPVKYNQDVVDARVKAMERGSRIPFLPELGLSEAFQTYVDRAGSDWKTAFGSPETEKETDLPPPPVAPPQASDSPGKEFLNQQYNRYFGSPEFDNVFGSGARGEGAPKDAAAMELLGNQIKAPKEDTNIASMYAAQSAMGRVNQDKIQEYFADADLPGNVKKEGEEMTALQKWAKANPMLAQRLYQKQQQKIQDAIPDNPAFDTGTAVRGETPGSLEQQMQYGAGSPISKSPTEYDISNRDEDDLNRRMRELGL